MGGTLGFGRGFDLTDLCFSETTRIIAIENNRITKEKFPKRTGLPEFF